MIPNYIIWFTDKFQVLVFGDIFYSQKVVIKTWSQNLVDSLFEILSKASIFSYLKPFYRYSHMVVSVMPINESKKSFDQKDSLKPFNSSTMYLPSFVKFSKPLF
eukprot:GHVP01035536.1.p1 GENE.GHVP01035536.1~~GHVP01035536.1.p1  ORF type:complete len:104 (-),score=1.88 GHVP01035536.1:124-435(-)